MTYRRMVTIVIQRAPDRIDKILAGIFLLAWPIHLILRVIIGQPPTWVTVGLSIYGGYLLARVVDYLRLAAAVGRAALPRKDTP